MKSILVILIGLSPIFTGAAQELEIDPDEIIQSVEEWMQDNLDHRALDELGVDKERVQRFLTELRRRFQGTCVYDLGALEETATRLLPVLEQFEETRPYATWLQNCNRRRAPALQPGIFAAFTRVSAIGDWRWLPTTRETRVENLLKQHKARTFDAIAGRLPAETQMYVPKVEATLRKREQVTLEGLKTPNG